jgi:Tfp pilus assembly protein PilX
VHGKLVVPHIPKVMGALVRCSSASGSFPQLQVACARVTASLARYGIDSTTSQEEAEEVMRALCAPLIDALSGKLEPVAANAAACLHALAETANWKHVREATVHEVCDRTTVALSEKATRTAAHMHLIRILASVNPDVLSLHGASLLRAGEEILEVTSNSWQLRKAAAQMLQSVLTILDKESLASELNPALHVRERTPPQVPSPCHGSFHLSYSFEHLSEKCSCLTHSRHWIAAGLIRCRM